MNTKLVTVLTFAGSLFLTGCGGDSANNGNRTVGPITQKSANNVTVNNIKFDSTNAVIATENSSDSLQVGMTVAVDGPVDGSTGVAEKISYDSEVEGPITSIDSTEKSMKVLGQIIKTDDSTVFDHDSLGNITFEDFSVGNVVEVSGMLMGDYILASRIEFEKDVLMPGDEIEVKGYIENYDPTGGNSGVGSFNIGSCTITVTENTDLDDMPSLDNGMFVEVETTYSDATVTLEPCSIIAEEIENEDDEIEDDDDGDDEIGS